MDLDPRPVRRRPRRLMDALGAETRFQAGMQVVRRGLIESVRERTVVPAIFRGVGPRLTAQGSMPSRTRPQMAKTKIKKFQLFAVKVAAPQS